jgi:hypothetical protein
MHSGWSVAAAKQGGNPVATANLSSTAAAYSGRKGARISVSSGASAPGDAAAVELLSPGYPLVAGRTYK